MQRQRSRRVDPITAAKWIEGFNKKHGYSPSIREMCDGLGIVSTSTAHALLKKCIKLGIVRVGTPSRRQLVVKEGI